MKNDFKLQIMEKGEKLFKSKGSKKKVKKDLEDFIKFKW